MKTTTIKKGTRAPFRFFDPIIETTDIWYLVKFENSCVYDIGPEDQPDVNKLFGVGYYTFRIFKKKEVSFLGKKWKVPVFRAMHHYNSIRFGWRYDLVTKMIEIVTYWYEKGVRNTEHLAWVELGKSYRYSMQIVEDAHFLSIYSKHGEAYELIAEKFLQLPGSEVAYPLFPYFGGNQKAPHDMTITVEKI